MAPPPELIDDAITEILICFPPDNPSCLQRAALVCKSWRRILSDPAFLRRYRAFRQIPPPLLGTGGPVPSFVPFTPFRPPLSDDIRSDGVVVIDCRHGRALLLPSTAPGGERRADMLVWDPMTGDCRRLRIPGSAFKPHTAAVLCAAAGCDHLGCHGGPFHVVYVFSNITDWFTRACVYSSETGAWSTPASLDLFEADSVSGRQSVLVGEALHFLRRRGILQYDLARHCLSAIEFPEYMDFNTTLLEAEGDRLGVAGMSGTELYLQYRDVSPDGIARWTQRTVINLVTITTLNPIFRTSYKTCLMGFAKSGSLIFLSTGTGHYMIDLKSMQFKKIGDEDTFIYAYAYFSFYILDSARDFRRCNNDMWGHHESAVETEESLGRQPASRAALVDSSPLGLRPIPHPNPRLAMAPSRPPPELVDDAVAEILLRLPPDEPRHLVRASLVCKRWRRVVADPAFPRRYRSFHRSPPLLGLLRNTYDDDSISVFLPTTSFRPRGGGHGFPGGIAVDCRHGRALLVDYTKMIWEGRVGILVWESGIPRRGSEPSSATPTLRC
ncbi:unnamed protein product [Urochloa decumbens]|uniref:F-box domain-containing protein n=1 Tax=Urochloa decumbens TaxID=240449 RepID=A0ABC9FK36_9POAL